MAVVAGDNNYTGKTGVCEPFTVGKAQLGINTTVHNDDGDVVLNGNLPLNGGAHDGDGDREDERVRVAGCDLLLLRQGCDLHER